MKDKMKNNLPHRPNLEHLRSQSKELLAALRAGDSVAVETFRLHLPAASSLSDEQIREGIWKLADAQSAVARATGFASWPQLSRHIEMLRGLEGEWHFESLEVAGEQINPAMLTGSYIRIDGDQFIAVSPSETDSGTFLIDVEANPNTIDIRFEKGSEADSTCYGLFKCDGSLVTFCLGLVGEERPPTFATRPGVPEALETLRRGSARTPSAQPFTHTKVDGKIWQAIELNINGQPLDPQFLPHARRIEDGDEVRVEVMGQVMMRATYFIDRSCEPWHINYLESGNITQEGIAKLDSEGVLWVCMGAQGASRPTKFNSGPGLTFGLWRPSDQE